MTYFGVLTFFLLPPLAVLALVVCRADWRRWRSGRPVDRLPYLAIGLHVALALIYTTPWDNYLVATGVWWYDPALVTGLRLGWVPIEEYTFFVVQTLFTGLWVVGLRRWSRAEPSASPRPAVRYAVAGLVFVAWLASVALLLSGWMPGRYLALILAWVLLPVLLQVAFGADVLIANRRGVLMGILPPTLYLWLVDALAIRSGTWTIDPAQITGWHIGPLPVEEMIFFLMTNVLIVFGMTLMLSEHARRRVTLGAQTVTERAKDKFSQVVR